MAVVYRITGDGIGDGANAAFFESQSDAKRALREYRTRVGDKKAGDGPDKLVISGRAELAAALNAALAYGGGE